MEENKTEAEICGTYKIEIPINREKVNCDELNYPWTLDPKGYFLVKIEGETIYCGFANTEHVLILELFGKNPDKIIKEIIKRDLCNKDKLGYIASELMIAYNCIKNGDTYVQR